MQITIFDLYPAAIRQHPGLCRAFAPYIGKNPYCNTTNRPFVCSPAVGTYYILFMCRLPVINSRGHRQATESFQLPEGVFCENRDRTNLVQEPERDEPAPPRCTQPAGAICEGQPASSPPATGVSRTRASAQSNHRCHHR